MNRINDILNNKNSIFNQDYKNNYINLLNYLSNKTILIFGAGGSIGSQVVLELIKYNPRKLILADINENTVVELIRDIRNQNINSNIEIEICITDICNKELEIIFKTNKVDITLNFSALKHVRSEDHILSLKRIFDVNIFGTLNLIKLSIKYKVNSFFSVSTDKASYPVNFMGASKRIMEKLMHNYSNKIKISSARFANVYMSDGSLFDGIKNRIKKNQTISGPSDVKRFFITSTEAAQISILAICCSENRDIFIPNMTKKDSIQIANLIIKYLNHEGIKFKKLKKKTSVGAKFYLNLSKTDTFGEKLIEKYYEKNEKIIKNSFKNIRVIKNSRARSDSIINDIKKIKDLKINTKYKENLHKILKRNIYTFNYKNSYNSLNDKL